MDSSVVSWPPCMVWVEVNTPAGLPASAPDEPQARGAVQEVLQRRRHVAEARRTAEHEAVALSADPRAWRRAGRSAAPAAPRPRSRPTPPARCAAARARRSRSRRRGTPAVPAPRWRRCASSRGPVSRSCPISPSRATVACGASSGPATKVPQNSWCHHLRRAAAGIYSKIRALAGAPDAKMLCKKCLVGGRVQGVFYRATAARRAQELAAHRLRAQPRRRTRGSARLR